jgi:hypothetical protein
MAILVRNYLTPDLNTRDSLLSGGQPFVSGFRQVIGNLINVIALTN